MILLITGVVSFLLGVVLAAIYSRPVGHIPYAVIVCFISAALGIVLASIYWRRRMAAEVQIARNDAAYWRRMAGGHGAEQIGDHSTFDIFHTGAAP